jgi:4-amino-4-deoxy-L-arabinose transferase-like glycosyltransferase
MDSQTQSDAAQPRGLPGDSRAEAPSPNLAETVGMNGPARRTETWAWFAALMGWSVVLATYGLSGGADFEPTDAWVAQTAREMLEAGQWVVPRFCDEIRLQKSPGPYWAVMATALPRGGNVDAVAVRLPNAVFGVAFVALVFLLARLVVGDRAAVFAGFAAASSVVFLYWTHRGASDFGVAVLIGVALTCLWAGSSVAQTARSRGLLWLAGYLTAGLGMAYKMPMPLACVGLPAFLWLWLRYPVPMVPATLLGAAVALAILSGGTAAWAAGIAIAAVASFGLVALAMRHWRTVLRWGPWHVLGLALFCLPWVPWVVALLRTEPIAWEKWRWEYWERFTGDLPVVAEHRHWAFYFYYLMPVFFFTVPYALSVPAALLRAVRSCGRTARDEANGGRASRAESRADAVRRDGMRFLLIWFVSHFAFFTAATGKEMRYFLPALPPLFVMLGFELAWFFDPKRPVAAWRAKLGVRSVYVLVPAALLGGAVALYRFNEYAGASAWADLWPRYVVAAAIFTVGMYLAARLFGRGRRGGAFAAMVGTMWALWLWTWPMLMPVLASEAPAIDFATQLRDVLPAEFRPALRYVDSSDPRVVWYSDVRIPRIIDQVELLELQGGERSLERERRLVAERMIDRLRSHKPVLFATFRLVYLQFMIEASRELAARGERLPATYLWLQSHAGPKHKQYVLFGNVPPPWKEPSLDPPSRTLEEAMAEVERTLGESTTRPVGPNGASP